ncbi:unnamed protein product [Schistocephalus solidus]|uniref:GPI transamidase component PIG-U n=1 Tax=Schistocephalus solidus TaxID=70667 RepID=A0A183T7W1_SCHSO|nr:unnamed protein product [Schistocephalus solidus]
MPTSRLNYNFYYWLNHGELLACTLASLLPAKSSWLDTTWSHLAVCSWANSSSLRTRLYAVLPIYIIHLPFSVVAPTAVQILADSCLGLPLLLRLFAPVFRRLPQSASISPSITPSNSLLLLVLANSFIFHDGVAYLLLSVWVLFQCFASSAAVERIESAEVAGLKRTQELATPFDAELSWYLRVLCRLSLIFLFCSLLSIQQWIDFITQLRASPFGDTHSRHLCPPTPALPAPQSRWYCRHRTPFLLLLRILTRSGTRCSRWRRGHDASIRRLHLPSPRLYPFVVLRRHGFPITTSAFQHISSLAVALVIQELGRKTVMWPSKGSKPSGLNISALRSALTRPWSQGLLA